MQHDIPVGKALRLKRPVKRIMRYGTAVHGKECSPTVSILSEAHIVPQPAFHSSPLIVIAACALFVIFIPMTESIDIKRPHVTPDAAETFDQFAVSHAESSLLVFCSLLSEDCLLT